MNKHMVGRRLLMTAAGIIVFAVGVVLGVIIAMNVARPEPAPAPQQQAPVVEKPVIKADPKIKLALFTKKIAVPTAIVSTGKTSDDRLFVVSRDGTITAVKADGSKQAKPFLDIRSRVLSSNEMGLLGLAFDPKFDQNGYFYVNYVDTTRTTQIARFQATGDKTLAKASTEKRLISLKQPYTNHNGGDLKFGPDGYLYIGLGDGGSAGDPSNRAQSLGTLFGKMLRIDVSKGDPYSIPTNNPFRAKAGAKPEIWAYGLRNPWRFNFDRKTHDLFIADVGQGKVEEVNFQPAASKGGENYGWRCYEGNATYNTDGCKAKSSYQAPIIAYASDEPRCSVTGGYVYRGQAIPELQEKYVYGDFCSGEIIAATHSGSSWKSNRLIDTSYSLSTFGEDSKGELYMADLASGDIFKVVTAR